MKPWVAVAGLTGRGPSGFHPPLSSWARSPGEVHQPLQRPGRNQITFNSSNVKGYKFKGNSEFCCLNTLLFQRVSEREPRGRMEENKLNYYYFLLSPAEMVSPYLTWRSWFWSQFSHPGNTDQQRKSESLDMNFKTPPTYPSQQAWHVAQWRGGSVWYRWAECQFQEHRVIVTLWEWGYSCAACISW